ncbi:uncharacterized protein Z518_04790 [Rhinocladiella mackenziei CBS 650.93]|uniref:Rhodopsin domain-containing protein n=1 Tax=Rhinocladiella mackenziei CBS 650.93 TaxID=1442369 RepID=A0A0D2IM25_9EURO|nr:uncharacterized protein Z518_04790 [Rhinocladiella mackenziei CBS 650.93]KIX06814.1 hypothetical protein Z518_04790 [Rhinocladiella mackenziei CBS 650.93]
MSDSTSSVAAGASARLTGAARGLSEGGLKAVAWAGVATAASFLSLRLFSRFREARRLFADDYWMVASFIVLTVNAVLQTLQTESLYYILYVSVGRIAAGEELITQGNIYVRYEFAIIGLMWTVLWCVKASFLALFWRLFEGLPPYKRLWWVVAVFSALAYAGCWIASAWTCHPPSTYFQFGQCSKPIDQAGSTISISYSTAVDILSDLMIMSLPLRLLRELQVSRPQKIGLGVVFCLGLAIIAVAIIRLTQIVGQARADPVGLAVWGLVESSVSVIIGSLPPLKSFLGKQIQKFTGAIYAYGGNSGGQHSGKIQGGHSAAGTRSPFASAISKSGAGIKSESIPLEDGPGYGRNSVTALKGGQIVVQKDFGWSRGGGDGSGSVVTTDDVETQAHSDEHSYGEEVRMVNFKEQEARIGIATSIGRRVSHNHHHNHLGHQHRSSEGPEFDKEGRIKTSWLH